MLSCCVERNWQSIWVLRRFVALCRMLERGGWGWQSGEWIEESGESVEIGGGKKSADDDEPFVSFNERVTHGQRA
eukprot:3187159-Rhodomonas_salina.1